MVPRVRQTRNYERFEWASLRRKQHTHTITTNKETHLSANTPGKNTDCDTIGILAEVTGLITTSLSSPIFKFSLSAQHTSERGEAMMQTQQEMVYAFAPGKWSKELKASKSWLLEQSLGNTNSLIYDDLHCQVWCVMKYLRLWWVFLCHHSPIIHEHRLFGLLQIRDVLIPTTKITQYVVLDGQPLFVLDNERFGHSEDN